MKTLRLEQVQLDPNSPAMVNRVLLFDADAGKLEGKDIQPALIPFEQHVDDIRLRLASLLRMDELELSQYRIIHNQPIENAYSAPFKLFLDITNRCQLACKFCLSSSSPEGEDYLQLSDCKEIADELGDAGLFMAKLGGGEPMLHRNFWEIVEVFRSNYVFVSISSNGVRITDEDVERSKDLKLKIGVSIEGRQETHDAIRGSGSHEKALQGFKKLASNDVPHISVRANIAPSTLDPKDIQYVIDLAKEHGTYARFNYMKPAGRAAADATQLIDFKRSAEYYRALEVLNDPKNLPYVKMEEFMMFSQPLKEMNSINYGGKMCGATSRSMHIDQDRNVSPCVFLGPGFQDGKYYSGDKMMDFWRGKRGKGFTYMRKLAFPEGCTSCDRGCKGECPALRLNFSQSANGPDPLCLKGVNERLFQLSTSNPSS